MSSKVVIGSVVGIIVLFGGAIVVSKINKPQEPLSGIKHNDQGQKHIGQGQSHEPYNSSPASSGPHYSTTGSPTDWGIYLREVPDETYLHNEEHGGVVITYKPDLSKDQIVKLQQLFGEPYTNKTFKPSRFVLTPRVSNKQPIELASWLWTLGLDKYDEATIIKFYQQHSNRSPEAGGKPTNIPINQANG